MLSDYCHIISLLILILFLDFLHTTHILKDIVHAGMFFKRSSGSVMGMTNWKEREFKISHNQVLNCNRNVDFSLSVSLCVYTSLSLSLNLERERE